MRLRNPLNQNRQWSGPRDVVPQEDLIVNEKMIPYVKEGLLGGRAVADRMVSCRKWKFLRLFKEGLSLQKAARNAFFFFFLRLSGSTEGKMKDSQGVGGMVKYRELEVVVLLVLNCFSFFFLSLPACFSFFS